MRRGISRAGLVALSSAALWMAFASNPTLAPGAAGAGGAGTVVVRATDVLPDLDTKRIDAAFAAVDRPDSPGCALGVVAAGRIAYARGYGFASLEQQVPITPHTVFDLGSTSKQVTSASVALLVLDGKLSLEDDVRKYLPELPDYGKTITVRRLLDHTSGLRDYTDVLSYDGHHEEDWTTAAEGLEAMTRQKELNFPPGTEFRYTNSGHFLASILVQRVSGKSLRAFAAERLFGPLGMTATTYFDDHTLVVPRRATGYAPREGGGFETSMSDWEQVGDGGVQSSIEDLVKWADELETGKVGGKALLDMMHTSGRLNDGTPTGYGLGLFMRTHRGLNLVTHGGAWAGFRANLLRVPERHVAAIVLCNVASANTEKLGLAAIDAALDALPAADRPPAGSAAAKGTPAGARPEAASLERLAGTYYNEHLGQVVTLALKEGSLRLDDSELTADGGARFHLKDRTLGLEFAAGGRTVTIDDPEDDAKPRVYVRTEAGGPESPLAGAYVSEALKEPCSVLPPKDKGPYLLRCGGGEEGPLRPLAPGLYDLGWGVARLTHDAGGKAATLTLTTRGIVGLTLRKKP
jgi:CubicO group peptidase (beta-lactamase class C family)